MTQQKNSVTLISTNQYQAECSTLQFGQVNFQFFEYMVSFYLFFYFYEKSLYLNLTM